jgi:glycogen debranching enzyme
LFEVGPKILEAEPGDSAFAEELTRALGQAFLRITDGPREILWLSSEGLLENGADYPLTWMDAVWTDRVHTPRWGLAVELQALFYRACTTMAELSEQAGDTELSDRARALRARLVGSFQGRFWCHQTNYPFDCLSASSDSADAWADPSVRPNALIALAVAPELFEPWQRQELLARVEELLLTPRGIRTLDPGDPRYRGHAGGTIEERSAASHQGAVWPHLSLYYVRAALAEGRAPDELRLLVQEILRGGIALGHVAQTADGDAPYRRRGSPAYAKATAMLLEALVFDLKVGVEGRTLW